MNILRGPPPVNFAEACDKLSWILWQCVKMNIHPVLACY